MRLLTHNPALKNNWYETIFRVLAGGNRRLMFTPRPKIYPPLVEHLKLQVRMNIKSRAVELRTSKHTTDTGALQKGADFIHGESHIFTPTRNRPER